MFDGIVIGGPAHGETRDPTKVGPVLVVPKQVRLAISRYADFDPTETAPAIEHVEYRLHEFHSADGKERIRQRVWLPRDVKPHEAFEYIIQMALRVPKS